MGCYLIPTAVAIIHSRFRRKSARMMSSRHQAWLGHLLLGGTIFGFVDHLWNGQLFLFGPRFMRDLALGFVITAVIFATWGIMVWRDRALEGQQAENPVAACVQKKEFINQP